MRKKKPQTSVGYWPEALQGIKAAKRLVVKNRKGDDSMKPLVRCLDLFCGAGGAGMGLSRAGFDVTGVDILPQPRYPFRFIQGDALAKDLSGFDFVWASPPCQAHTAMQHIRKNGHAHPDLIPAVRAKLEAWGGPWVIENVKGAPLRNAVMLCGTMFGLRIIKHRYFETSFDLPCLLPPCNHRDVYDPWHGKGRTADAMREAQGTPWIPASGGASRKRGTSGDCNNAIPPAYSEWIARQWYTANNAICVKPEKETMT